MLEADRDIAGPPFLFVIQDKPHGSGMTQFSVVSIGGVTYFTAAES